MDIPSAKRRIGIFGGSFDPPHSGHFICARAVAERLNLERVLVIPTNIQPHKPEGAFAPAALRLKMVAAACRSDPLFKVSGIEITLGGISYTADTLSKLRKRYSRRDYELILIVGADAVLDLPRWRSPERIFKLAQVAVMDRPDALQRCLPEPWEHRLIRIPTPQVEVSSTEIRTRVASGQSIACMTPQSVERLIRKHHLYSV